MQYSWNRFDIQVYATKCVSVTIIFIIISHGTINDFTYLGNIHQNKSWFYAKQNVEEKNVHAVDYPNKCRQKRKTATECRWTDDELEFLR